MKKFIQLFMDQDYLRRLFSLAIPIMLQNLMSSSLNLIGGLMVGQLGEVSIAAVGLSNQFFFILTLFLFGISSGSGAFLSQFWGKQDIRKFRFVFGLCLGSNIIGGILFTMTAVFLPEQILGVFTADPLVIAAGRPYLQLSGAGFIFAAGSYSLAAAFRNTGSVRPPVFSGIVALICNIIISYVFIFGEFGLPALGIMGAAIGALASRIIEFSILFYLNIHLKMPASAPLRDIFAFSRSFSARVLARALPVAMNELLWGLGVSAYNAVYAHIGTNAIAAVNITSTVENLALVCFVGITDATAILIGNRIGAGDQKRAETGAKTSLVITLLLGILVGVLIYNLAPHLLNYYQVSKQVAENALAIFVVMSFTFWFRMCNLLLYVGILRSGGDTRFAFIADAGVIWSFGVPTALIVAFCFHAPIYLVYLAVMSEEFIKLFIVLWRFLSGKWINNLTNIVENEIN